MRINRATNLVSSVNFWGDGKETHSDLIREAAAWLERHPNTLLEEIRMEDPYEPGTKAAISMQIMVIKDISGLHDEDYGFAEKEIIAL